MALAPAVARAAALQGKLLLWGPRANRDRTWKLKSNHIYRLIVTVAGTAHRMRRAIARTPPLPPSLVLALNNPAEDGASQQL